MLGLIKSIFGRRDLLTILIGRNLKIRYKSSTLGFFWSLLTPVFLITVYAIFAGIMKWNTGRKDFLEFLVVGVVVWQFLSVCLNDALHTITGHSNLIKKTAFPRSILPLAMVLANLVNFLLTTVVLVLFLAVTHSAFGNLLILPVVILTQSALCLGLGLLISCCNVFFRDTEHIMGVATLAWFFLSPVFYSVQYQLERIPAELAWVAFLNPMTGILCSYRGILMSDPYPGLVSVGISFSVCWIVLLAGVGVFQLVESRFADEL